MVRSRRPAIGTLVLGGGLLVAGAAGAAWWLADAAAGRSRIAPPGASVATRGLDSVAERALAEGAGEDLRGDATGDGAIGPIAARSSAEDPFETGPGEQALAAIEARGNWLVWGEVIGFDDQPVAGAAIWCGGEHVATSDGGGRYRIEFEPEPRWHLSISFPTLELAAVADGVGSAAVPIQQRGGRHDLRLRWATRFAGTALADPGGAAVAAAAIELLATDSLSSEPLFRLATRADAQGRFSFVGVPPGVVALRAESERFASAGWFARRVEKDVDQLDLPFLLVPRVRVSGRFAPPPPPGAKLVVLPLNAPDVPNALQTIEIPVATDGSFGGAVAATLACEACLLAAGGSPWRGRFEVPIDATGVDLGTLALEPGCFLVEVDLPREILALGIEARLRSGLLDSLAWPLDLDGRARVGPFAPRAGLEAILCFASGHGRLFSGTLPMLAAGEELRWSPEPLPQGTIVVAGRVTDVDGGPAAAARVDLLVPYEGGVRQLGTTTSDEQGRYWSRLEPLWRTVATSERFLARGGALEVFVQGRRGLHRAIVRPAVPVEGAILRFDVQLEPGRSLCGVLLDADGEPLGGVWLSALPDPGGGTTPRAPTFQARSRSDGTFSFDALAARSHRVVTSGRDGWLDLGVWTPGADRVTLRVPRE